MINPWAEIAKMKKDFPINSMVMVNEDVEGIGGMILKVTGYFIEEGIIELTGANGREFELYPEEIEPYFESQVC
jgi:hypothetical protein